MTLTLLDRRSGMCAFPVEGEGAATLFCGGQTGNRRAGYCDEHAALMTNGPGRSLNEVWFARLGRSAVPVVGSRVEVAALGLALGETA